MAEHKLDTYSGYLASHKHTQQHTTQDEPMLTLPPPALPSLSMETSSMDLNRGVVAPYEPNKGARRRDCARCMFSPCLGRRNGAHRKFERRAEHPSWMVVAQWVDATTNRIIASAMGGVLEKRFDRVERVGEAVNTSFWAANRAKKK